MQLRRRNEHELKNQEHLKLLPLYLLLNVGLPLGYCNARAINIIVIASHYDLNDIIIIVFRPFDPC